MRAFRLSYPHRLPQAMPACWSFLHCVMSLAVALLLAPALAQAATTVESFTPQGTVKGVRQVQARFSGQVVAFGDLRLGDPFDIDCPEAGSGRWIDGSNWSYDFTRDLAAGVTCRFTLKAGSRDLAGAPIQGEQAFLFDTGGPAIVAALPGENGTIDERQVFVLALDTPARVDTIAANAWCRADGINEKIPVRLVTGSEREQVLAARRAFVRRHLAAYRAGGSVVSKEGRAAATAALPLAVLRCARTLPADAPVTLVWGAGIASTSGIVNRADQPLAFRSRPDFSARFACQRARRNGPCIPGLPLRLSFSAPVAVALLHDITLAGPGGKRWPAELESEGRGGATADTVTFTEPLPPGATFRLQLPAGLRDDAGRTLVNAARFPLQVRTGEAPPLVKFPARFGIIEARGDHLLPVTVRNVEAPLGARALAVTGSTLRVGDDDDEAVMRWLRRFSGGSGWNPDEQHAHTMTAPLLAGEGQRFTLPKPNGRKAFEVVGIPLKKPGFHVVELASPKLGGTLLAKGGTAYVSAAALVTNLSAHLKLGKSSSLVWVTSLDRGVPVAGARVTLRACTGKVLWQGATDAQGLARIGTELPSVRCGYQEDYFVSARKAGDFTFTLSNWNQGIEAWRFHLPTEERMAPNVVAATVFDRTLLRAGETVHMKHFLRRHGTGGVEFVADGEQVARREYTTDGMKIVQEPARPDRMFILHEGSDQRHELALAWRQGSAAVEWPIPADARQGWYQVLLGGQESGRFRVEQFRVPSMKAVLQGPREPAVNTDRVALDVQLAYLSGGIAGGTPVKVSTLVEPRAVYFEDYADFTFAGPDVKEGVERERAMFDDDESGHGGDDENEAKGDVEGGIAGGVAGGIEPGARDGRQEQPDGGAAARSRSVTLDRTGGARIVLDQLPRGAQPADLLAEVNWQDANGETLTGATRIPLWPSARLIGIAPDGWAMSRKALKFTVAVLDLQGRPVADAPVQVDYFRRDTYSHRRRLIGGFYAYENSTEVKALGQACAGRTDAKGLLACAGPAPQGGNLILRARTEDAAGNRAVTSRETWVADGDDWWYKVSDNDRIDLLPERKRYEPGEQATFQVRMPFRHATALITVEREGLIDAYVRELSGDTPAFTIPVKGQHAPNVYVSALVVRGRVAGAAPTALVDLGKPAYKLGIAPLRVGWAAHELKVRVDTDRPVYKVRDKASVTVQVMRADGSPAPAGSEVALAAVDAALLELMPNDSWQLLEAMMRQRALQVSTSTAQMQVVGKRHFGRKAVPSGGGGGKGGARELFDTLLFWQAGVKLDAHGAANVQVPLNDALTSFRIVAIGHGEAGLFGTGHADVRTTQALMLVSGLPPLVRAGDRVRAVFTVRNTTDAPRDAGVTATMGGTALPPRKVLLAPGQAREVTWDVTVPPGVTELAWQVAAAAGDSTDRLRVRQQVQPAVPVRTVQATLLQLAGPQSITVQAPGGALPGAGGVRALFAARLGGELPGVREWMAAYPYSCLEQRASQAIALDDAARWQRVADMLPAYLDDDGLAKYFALMPEGSDTLTAYLLSVSAQAGRALAPMQKARMEDALEAFVEGRIVRGSPLATADLAVRKLAALEALSRSQRVKPAMLESFTIQPNLWPTSALIDWYLVLSRTTSLPQRDARLREAEQILRSRLNLQGTSLAFSTERSDDWWWLMASADVNANRLLLAMLDNPAWRADMGRLARGTLGRQQRGHWGTTVANAWGTLALQQFSQAFESVAVTGNATVALAGERRSVVLKDATADTAGSAAADATAATLPWPRGAASLDLRHDGTGKPWVTVQSLAAVPLAAPLSSGYTIRRTVTPVQRATAGAWSRGDIYRVHLELQAQGDMTWVVVDDPIPAGATVLGSGLGGDSAIATQGEKSSGRVWPAFQERTFAAFRSYYQFVPKGTWSVDYTVRLNSAGTFLLPPSRVEAMYSPEMFGAVPNAAVEVQ
jgi:uncharacterized protein YfaS (alpha-2-macroglobulin family)